MIADIIEIINAITVGIVSILAAVGNLMNKRKDKDKDKDNK